MLSAIASMPLPGDAQRIFHGRGALHPDCAHLSLDFFAPVWLLTSFQPVAEDDLAVIGSALAQRWEQLAPGEPLHWVFQCRHEGQSHTQVMAGTVPDPHWVTEAGVRYRVNVAKGQNHGLFLDMAQGRRWVHAFLAARTEPRSRVRVLNLFAYTCAFSVVARLAGARHVTNLDMSKPALAIGQQNHRANGVLSDVSFLPHDLFASWGKVTRGGPYGLIIIDPPSYQKGSFVATKDYARLIKRLPDLLAPDGHVLLCLNAPELGPAFLKDAMGALAPELAFVERLANPPAFADVSEERSLKALVYKAPPRSQ
ncbi:23S rRNA (cytosine1962-C5)-methyltransferase [Variovorax ginsengisoli]|uniref:23S rRNA (Cytosine1962-C5)-methyltransferase n=1 Tax=Variovorax ginsengisoli TaxID=363844 RepID=A0ABT9S996_9BURK|nr:23S rRNA (cytosine1962-C5)-methyltransferase [Variovorax ginsengisoli]